MGIKIGGTTKVFECQNSSSLSREKKNLFILLPGKEFSISRNIECSNIITSNELWGYPPPRGCIPGYNASTSAYSTQSSTRLDNNRIIVQTQVRRNSLPVTAAVYKTIFPSMAIENLHEIKTSSYKPHQVLKSE